MTPEVHHRIGSVTKTFTATLVLNWIGHNGEIPGYNTYLFYHPDLDAVVVVLVKSDISAGKCPKDVPVMKEWPRTESSKRSPRRLASPHHRRPSR